MKKKLNIFNIPLNGINLVEASAGTGKTTAIVLMYLRLLLGIENKKNIKPLLIQEILIVTFTNFAKEEIYKRIKENIEKLSLYCINKNTKSSILQPFFKKIKDFQEARYILERAKQNIHCIAIYTIHEFCKNMLQLDGLNINKQIIDNEQFLYLQAIEDFWRSYFYKLPKIIINIILEYYKTPESLLNELKPIFNFNIVYFKQKFNKYDDIITCHEKNIKIINIFKKKWINYHIIILNVIKELQPNKKIYTAHNVSRWQKNIIEWAQSETKNYEIPSSLKYFSKELIIKNTKNIENNQILFHFFFKDIKEILNKKISLKNIILFQAIKVINTFLKKEKNKKCLLGFNDLLEILLKYIKKEKQLKKIINKKYPVAFIDEFQDTNIQQYQIFNTLYNVNDKNTSLFLIGDPKQSIYSFRGADIFSYLYAKSKIKQYYYLDINWRSSTDICKSVNNLFSRNKKPFLLDNIPYINISSASSNKNIIFKIRGKIQKAISIYFKKQEKIHIEDYQEWIAKQCANEISYWLICAKRGEAILINKNQEKIVQESDIVILVRNKNEASIIQNALNQVNIQSTYLSSNINVFQTIDAYELLIILKNILKPSDIALLKKSIFTHIFYEILLQEKKQENIEESYFIIKKLYEYREIWKNKGIFYTIKNIVLDYQKYSNHLDKYKYYQKNINFLHIGELLEEKSEFFYKESSLIRWFEKKISEKNNTLENEHIRYFKQEKSIKIITIHKSKGLEYPIVWIPFASTYKKSKLYLYHQKNFKIFFDLNQNKETKKISDKERLSEDLRFLYVAITRSIYHCSLGMGDIINKKNQKKSNNHESSLGYIIQRGYYMDYKNILNELKLLDMKPYIKVMYDTMYIKLPYTKKDIYLLSTPQYLIKKIPNNFQITSFTNLKKRNIFFKKKQNYYEINNILNKNKTNKKIIFENFPKGKKTGILIHYILRKIDFKEKLNIEFFYKSLKKYDFSSTWASILMSWIYNIIHIKLKNINLNLSMLKPKQYIKEMEFFLPIQKRLNSIHLNNIIQSLDKISSLASQFSFDPIKGILKGSIDLVFLWNKRYYIIDYKSNYLGDHSYSYSLTNIEKEIIKNRYDLQYQIYTVALHQYLNKKIKKYNYKDNFGGIFYMFLRGINQTDENNSIFYTLPNYLLIKKLVNLLII